MQEFWNKIANHYGEAQDLEQTQREYVGHCLQGKRGNLIELACGNGQTIATIIKYNDQLNIEGIDYNHAMVEKAKKRFPQYSFKEADVLMYKINQTYDYVICVNSMHNFPSKELIFSFLRKAKNFVKPGGLFMFDIRNYYNPFVRYGYRKNRKKGLDFFTLKADEILKIFKSDFEIIDFRGICYNSLKSTGLDNSNVLYKLIYRIYLLITKIKRFSPYQFIILKRKDV